MNFHWLHVYYTEEELKKYAPHGEILRTKLTPHVDVREGTTVHDYSTTWGVADDVLPNLDQSSFMTHEYKTFLQLRLEVILL